MRFPKNTTGRDFVVGDIHGCYDLLMQKLDEVKFKKVTDRLFSVGDLIDRGMQSEKCMRLVSEDWFYAVRGNHEQMMIEAVLNRQPHIKDLWLHNGGSWSMFLDDDELYELADLANTLPWFMEVETSKGVVGILHAESATIWQENHNHDEDAIIWGRSKIKRNDLTLIDGIDYVMVGHTPVDKPISLGNVTYIDTGAFFSKVLTVEQIQ